MSKFAGYPAILDMSVTLFLGFIFFGTWSGMVAAIVGGLFFSFYLTIYRYFFGYQVLTKKGWVFTVPNRWVWSEKKEPFFNV